MGLRLGCGRGGGKTKLYTALSRKKFEINLRVLFIKLYIPRNIRDVNLKNNLNSIGTNNNTNL